VLALCARWGKCLCSRAVAARALWLLAGCGCLRALAARAVAARVLRLLALCGCSHSVAGRDDRCRTQARIAIAAHRAEADPVHFLERTLAPEPEDRVTAAEESLAHPSFSSAGARYVHACSGSLPNVSSGRESSEVRKRQVSFYSRGSADSLYSVTRPWEQRDAH
jgi:hypothetical protein